MEPSLATDDAQAPQVRVVVARVLQAVGWVGVLGIVLTVWALAIAHQAWRHERTAASLESAVRSSQPASPDTDVNVLPVTTSIRKLPSTEDIPNLLSRLERSVTSNDIAWSAADYRLSAAAGSVPGSLEIRVTLKGPYPKVRSAVVQMLGSSAALSFREMSFTRSSVDVADVEAKLVVGIFIEDQPSSVARH